MIRLVFCTILGFVISGAAFAKGVNLSSDSYILVDYSTMQVLESKNEGKKISPAGLTKVLTAYIVFDYINKGIITLNDEVLVSSKAWKTGGTKMFIEVGKKVTIEDLLKGLIVQSGNDSAVALAEHISTTVEGFAEVMNHYAKELGLKNSKFDNPAGFSSEGSYTTVKDLSILAYRTIKDYPELLNYYSIKDFEFNNIFQKSSNKMLSSDYFDGMMTGFSKDFGNSYIGTASNDSNRLILVQSGAETSRLMFGDAEILSSHYFDNFKRYKLASQYEIIKEATTPVIAGSVNYVRAAAMDDVVFMLSNDRNPKINMQLKMVESVKAPVRVGQKVGELIVYIDELEARRVDIITVEDVGYGSNHKRFFEYINNFLRTGILIND